MSDIVERIRQMVRDRLSGYHDPGICAELTGAADELEYLRTLASNAVHEYPVASGLYVDGDGQAGYGALKAMRLHLKLAPNRGFLHIPDPVGTPPEGRA